MKLNELNIKAFRGIRNLTLKGFQDVNLLLGDNDAGKTTVLEAVILSGVCNSIDEIIRCSRERVLYNSLLRSSYSALETFYSLFPFSDEPEKTIELSMKFDETEYSMSLNGHLIRTENFGDNQEYEERATRGGKSPNKKPHHLAGDNGREEIRVFEGAHKIYGKEYHFEVPENYRYKVPEHPELKQALPIVVLWASSHLSRVGRSALTTKKGEQNVVEVMRLIDPDIEGIKLVEGEIGTHEVIEHKQYGEVPLFTYGDGIKKILALAGAVVDAENGTLLIDEIETSLQASLLSKIFTWLMKACKEMNVQLFATTHSLEAISVLASCAMEMQNPETSIAGYRLKRHGEEIRVKRFSGTALNQLVNGSGMDVR